MLILLWLLPCQLHSTWLGRAANSSQCLLNHCCACCHISRSRSRSLCLFDSNKVWRTLRPHWNVVLWDRYICVPQGQIRRWRCRRCGCPALRRPDELLLQLQGGQC
jgi:hypothetical protein